MCCMCDEMKGVGKLRGTESIWRWRKNMSYVEGCLGSLQIKQAIFIACQSSFNFTGCLSCFSLLEPPPPPLLPWVTHVSLKALRVKYFSSEAPRSQLYHSPFTFCSWTLQSKHYIIHKSFKKQQAWVWCVPTNPWNICIYQIAPILCKQHAFGVQMSSVSRRTSRHMPVWLSLQFLPLAVLNGSSCSQRNCKNVISWSASTHQRCVSAVSCAGNKSGLRNKSKTKRYSPRRFQVSQGVCCVWVNTRESFLFWVLIRLQQVPWLQD